MPGSVCAVVVTYNRLDLLRECLAAVTGQSHPPDHVLVVDNASTDGTRAAVAAEHPGAEILALPTNEGSSGGFHEGMRRGLEGDWEWLWVMDDDTIPHPDALEKLLDASEDLADEHPSLLASAVLWTDGTVHPMNPPGIDLRDLDRFVKQTTRGYVPIRYNTFPSLLVRAEAVRRHGPPRKPFFIWSDDIDFTARILRDEERGFLVLSSVATHKTKTPHSPYEGGERYYFAVRNGIWMLRGDALAPKERVGHTLLMLEHTRRFFLEERGATRKAIGVVARGVRDGLRRPA